MQTHRRQMASAAAFCNVGQHKLSVSLQSSQNATVARMLELSSIGSMVFHKRIGNFDSFPAIATGVGRISWQMLPDLTGEIPDRCATLGCVQVPQAPVEAAIARSIVFVAVEVLHAPQKRGGD